MTDCIRLTTKEDYIRRVNIVRNYVYSNVDKDICLAELATLSAFSPYHFHRIMKAFLGEPIGAFIIRTKMEAAAKQLRFTENTISDIAYSVGYDTPSSLTKAFVKLYGISPSEFRTIKNYKIMTEQNPTVMLNLSKPAIREVEPKQVIYINARGAYNTIDFNDIFARLWAEVKRQGLYSAGIEHIGVYYNDPKVTSEENISSDICLRVCKPATPHNDIGVKTIAGGKYAVFTYIGEYNKVGAAYDRIYGEWLPESGYEPRNSPIFEKYISDPRRTEPEKRKTDIYIPIH